MALLSLFKKADVAPTTPHRAALLKHNAAIKALDDQRLGLSFKIASTRKDTELAAAHAAKVLGIQGQIDTANADAKYSGHPPPDLTALRRELADAQAVQTRLDDEARAAATVKARYDSELAALHRELLALHGGTDRLVHAVARYELLPATVQRVLKARADLEAALVAAFVPAFLADSLMPASGSEWSGSGRMHDLHVPLPAHPEFEITDAGGIPGRREMATAAEALKLQLMTELAD